MAVHHRTRSKTLAASAASNLPATGTLPLPTVPQGLANGAHCPPETNPKAISAKGKNKSNRNPFAQAIENNDLDPQDGGGRVFDGDGNAQNQVEKVIPAIISSSQNLTGIPIVSAITVAIPCTPDQSLVMAPPAHSTPFSRTSGDAQQQRHAKRPIRHVNFDLPFADGEVTATGVSHAAATETDKELEHARADGTVNDGGEYGDVTGFGGFTDSLVNLQHKASAVENDEREQHDNEEQSVGRMSGYNDNVQGAVDISMDMSLLRRSAREHERTVVTDYTSGLVPKEAMTHEAMVKVAAALFDESHRKDLRGRLAALLEVPGVAENVQQLREEKIQRESAKAVAATSKNAVNGRPAGKTGTLPTAPAAKTGTAPAARANLNSNRKVSKDEWIRELYAARSDEEEGNAAQDMDVVGNYLQKRLGNYEQRGASKQVVGGRTNQFLGVGIAAARRRVPCAPQKQPAPVAKSKQKLPLYEDEDDVDVVEYDESEGMLLTSAAKSKQARIGTQRGGTQKKMFRAQKSKQPHRNMREQADSEDEDEMGEVNTKKRRTRKTRAKMSKKKIEDDDGGEVFDLDDEQGARYVEPTQLGFYNGEKKLVITRGIFFVRLFLFNVNAYPDKAELEEWSAKGYRAGAQLTYGINYEERMPEFTEDMSILLQNESWGIRGKVKRAVVKIIDKVYRVYPHPSKYARYPNADEWEMQHVQQRVESLLGPASLFLKGYLDPDGELVSYAHPAIKELIHNLIFSRKTSKRPLASQDLDAFDPIPLPLIAYACTALLNGLEEYKSGEHVKRDFSEADYSNYYRTILENLYEMEASEEEGHLLQKIREHIFETGCVLLKHMTHNEFDRPPAPFIPSGNHNGGQN